MSDKIPCITEGCKATILQTTADRTGGYCMPCFQKIKRKEQEEFIQNIELFLVCEVNSKIVGSTTLIRGKYNRIKHTAMFGITILREYSGLGIGSKMLNEVLVHSKNHGIEKIELEVFERNTRAINLYKKYGFIEEGKKVRHIKIEEEYDNIIIMSKFI